MICETCKGTGILLGNAHWPTVSCSYCHGEGKMNEEQVGYGKRKHPHDICSELQRKELEKSKMKEDMVNHPKHYTFGTIEVITVIDDWGLGFYEGQVIKYVGRAKHKGNELEDLRKAQWYLNRKIEQLEKEK